MPNKQTRFTDSKSRGDNKSQGRGGGDRKQPTTSATGGNISPVVSSKAAGGSHLVPRSADVNGPRTAERGGHSRTGHFKAELGSGQSKAGNPKTPRKDT